MHNQYQCQHMKKSTVKSRKTVSVSAFIFIFINFITFSFEWPMSPESFNACFAQLRGERISPSLIFEEPSEVKAADDGHIILFISEYRDDTEFFPSTLGNAYIVAHADNLLTVYANLDKDSLSRHSEENPHVKKGETLGESGSSSWHEGKSSLEFQAVDTKNSTSINPKALMPRTENELPLGLSGITLQNRSGSFFDISRQSYIPAGIYRVYRNRENVAVPYRTRVVVNGAISDEISFDILRQDGKSLCVSGKGNYPKSVLYPDTRLQLAGEAVFAPGRNSLHISLSDFLGKETTQTYIINSR